MSENPPTEMNVPTQPAEPEAAPVMATASESEGEVFVTTIGVDISDAISLTPIIPALDIAQPASKLASEPASHSAPASVETTSTPSRDQEPVPEAIDTSAAALEVPVDILADSYVVVESVEVTAAPAPGAAPREYVVASEVAAEQVSTSASASALNTAAPPEQGGAPVTQTESAQGLVVEAVTAAAPPNTAAPVLAAAPPVAANTAPVTDPASTLDPGLQATTAADIASGSDSEGEAAPSTTTAPEAEHQSEPRGFERPRSEQLWFYDGNIIIQTPAKQYRVHRSVLAMHSTFFKDMFELPPAAAQGKQANPMLDSCPVVEVPDAAEDWDAVLSIIYHTWEG